ncbi:MAG: nuclear transport factor 2 family protein, partial [Ilumatobacteraceae bacterium]
MTTTADATPGTAQTIATVATAMAEQRWGDVLDHLTPDVVAHVPAVGTLDGLDALAAFLLETSSKTDDGEHFEVLDTL